MDWYRRAHGNKASKREKQQQQEQRAQAYAAAARGAASQAGPGGMGGAAFNQQQQQQYQQQQQQQHQHQDNPDELGGEQEEDEDAQVAIYTNYLPKKVQEKYPDAKPHPDPIVETSSLGGVEPPNITYDHHIQDVVARGDISNAQLETVLYTMMRWEQRLESGHRCGFFLGDGAGVGKGRQIAAVIKEFFIRGGKRALWVSTSNDLRFDARRDLDDLGANIAVYPQKKDALPKGDLSKLYPSGVLFLTYSLLVSKGASASGTKKAAGAGKRKNANANLANLTGDAQPDEEEIAKQQNQTRAELLDEKFGKDSRLHQLVAWLGADNGETMLVFDEAHKAKNLVDETGLKSTATGLAVRHLQDALMNTRVLYSSATGASEPRNLLYMVRLGPYGFASMSDMVKQLTSSGLGALELFCMGLKATGTYLSRTLSYQGAEFIMEQVDIDPRFQVMYDRSSQFWSLVHNILKKLPTDKGGKGRAGGNKIGLFWAAQQRFYRQMLIAAKVPSCAKQALNALERDMCVVIGLQSTGEANTTSARENIASKDPNGDGDSMDDLISAPRMVLHGFISKHLFRFKSPQDWDISQLRQLQALVYACVKEWRKQPCAADEAQRRQQRDEAMEARLARVAAAKQRVEENGLADSDDEEDLMAAAEEKDVDAVLQQKRDVAALNGNLIDLSSDMGEAEVGRLTAEMEDEEDKSRQEKVNAAAVAEEARLKLLMSEVEARVSKLTTALQAVPVVSTAAAVAPTVRAAGKAGASSAAASNLEDELEDSLAPSRGAAPPAAKGRRVAALDSDDDDADVGRGSKAAEDEATSPPPRSRLAAGAAAKAAAANGAKPAAGTSTVAVTNGSSKAKPAAKGKGKAKPADSMEDDVTEEESDSSEQESGDSEADECGPKHAKNTTGKTQVARQSRPRTSDSGSVLSEIDTNRKRGRANSQERDTAKGSKAPAAAAGPSKVANGVKAEPVTTTGPAKAKSTSTAKAGARKKKSTPVKKLRRIDSDIEMESSDSEVEVETSVDDSDDEDFEEEVIKPSSAPPRHNRPTRANAAVIAATVTASRQMGGGAGPSNSGLSGHSSGAVAVEPTQEDLVIEPLRPGREQLQALAWKARLDKESAYLASLKSALARHRSQPQTAPAGNRQRGSAPNSECTAGPSTFSIGGSAAAAAAAGRPPLPPNHLTGLAKAKVKQEGAAKKLKAEAAGEPKAKGGKSKAKAAVSGSDDDSEDGSDLEDDEEGLEDEVAATDGSISIPEPLRKIRTMMLKLLEKLELPANPLDDLIDRCGGDSKVAEMTGRKGGLVKQSDGTFKYTVRREEESQKMVNIKEKQSFMDGEKLVAIISEAASTGISLQADKRVANQKRRFHITLELPWSADKAIQQFGRSHRSNQASAPIYCMLITKCGGEYRFAGAVAKRLASLGALLQGDRRALGASGDLKQYDIDNKWGEQALNRIYDDITGSTAPMPGVVVPELPDHLLPSANGPAGGASQYGAIGSSSFLGYAGNVRGYAQRGYRNASSNLTAGQTAFMDYMVEKLNAVGLVLKENGFYSSDPKVKSNMPRFLNRMLGLEMLDQKLLFTYFCSTLEAVIATAKSSGQYSESILSLHLSKVTKTEHRTIHTDPASGASTYYTELDVDDGLSWDTILAERDAKIAEMRAANAPEARINKVGFYTYRRSQNYGGTGHPLVLMATEVRKMSVMAAATSFWVKRPNQVQGWIFKQFELDEKYKKCNNDAEAKKHWEFWHSYLERGCLHGDSCVRRARDGACSFGSRFYKKYLISGAVLPLMKNLFECVGTSRYGERSNGKKTMPRVLRATLEDGEVVVGLDLLRGDADLFLERIET